MSLVAVYGALRSGTTMLRLMLDGHSRIACPGETDFLVDHYDPRADRHDGAALADDRIFRRLGAPPPRDLGGAAAFRSMVGALRRDDGGPLVLMHHRHLGRLLTLAPGIKLIHLVRDPRDVARSAIGMGWAGNVYYGADTWLRTEREWEAAAPRLAPGQALELRYEALLSDPRASLEALCAFVGVAFEEDMLNYDQRSTYAPPDPALARQWRRKLSAREIGWVEGRCGALMAARGYAPAGPPPAPPGPGGRLRLWADHKRRIWAHRIARYGVVDPVLFALSRRIGARSLARAARGRMQRKAEAHLK